MYKTPNWHKTSLKVNNGYIGESIEQKVNRILTNKEPIKDGAPLIFTERSQGVIDQYNIRADRFEMALEATDSLSKSRVAQRLKRAEAAEAKKNMEKEKRQETTKDGGETTGQSTAGNDK